MKCEHILLYDLVLHVFIVLFVAFFQYCAWRRKRQYRLWSKQDEARRVRKLMGKQNVDT